MAEMGEIAGRYRSVARTDAPIDDILALCIAVCLALQAWLALSMEINWDEFYFLSLIYDHQRGELATAPQTLHVHLLGWLTATGSDEIRQIVFGRFFMLVCETATCVLTYALCRTFFARTPSLIAVLAYAAAGHTIIHGASFRADPLSAALTMAALLLVARGPLTLLAAVTAALAAAVALLVTVKVVFYAPAFAALAWWRLTNSKSSQTQIVRWLFMTALFAVMITVLLYSIHSASLPSATAAIAQRMMSGAAQTTIVESGFFPRLADVGDWVLRAPVQAQLLVFGAAMTAMGVVSGSMQERRRSIALLLCAAPLLSLLFYRNAFPYFLAFILPPACLLVALACEPPRFLSRYYLGIAGMMVLSSTVVCIVASYQEQDAQRNLVGAVHQVFPEPVTYIDRSSMIGSFPKRGFFMSTWGRTSYREGSPIFANILARETVPLLLVNSPSIEHAVGLRGPVTPDLALMPEDREVLRRNYIPHWGLIWVAGYRVDTGTDGAAINVAIPGIYTLEGGDAAIDERAVISGGTVHLARGTHLVRSTTPGVRTLRWGDHLRRPGHRPSHKPLFIGF